MDNRELLTGENTHIKHWVLALHLVNQGDFTDWELSWGNGSQPRKINPYPHPCPWRNGSEYGPEVLYQKTAWGWGGSDGTACREAQRQPSPCTVNTNNSRVWTWDKTHVNKQLRNIWKRSRLGENSWKTFERNLSVNVLSLKHKNTQWINTVALTCCLQSYKNLTYSKHVHSG